MGQSTSNSPKLSGRGGLSTGEYVRLCSSEQRRATVAVLADSTFPRDLRDLAAAVASRAGAGSENAADVEARLHHVHLPKLADAGLVTYDRERNRIESASIPDDLEGI